MNILDIIGLVFLMIVMPIPIGWIVVHNTINFWRKLGKGVYVVGAVLWIISAFLVYKFKEIVLFYRLDYFTGLQIFGLLILVFAFFIDRKRARVFGFKELLGFPELVKGYKQKLITSGIYSRVRHPRYLVYILSAFGMALFTKLVSLFLFFIVFVFLMYFLALSEEKELRRRFGKKYEEYAKKTPMMVPRLTKIL